MEIDNENIWTVLNILTSACQQTVGLVYRHIPDSYPVEDR